jgi:uncharacterized protein (DUF1800 family)
MKTGFMDGSSQDRHGVPMDLHRHIFNRLTFGATGELLDAAAGLSPEALVEQLLAAPPLEPGEPVVNDDDGWSTVPQWWLDTMRRTDAGIHERMVWCWHAHLTSSMDVASPVLMFRQHLLLRRHALGNFRELLQEITIDPAMLFWLNGAWSTAESPNENYARELMELFALGRNEGYTEDDVHHAAIALSGWWVDGEADDTVRFDENIGPQRSVALFDRRVRNAAEVIDAVCDHPACAPHIAGVVYRAIHGAEPTDEVRAELAAVFAGSGLEIRPLLEATVRHPSFLGNPQPRPRTHLEWYIALTRLYRRDDLDVWPLHQLGQMPFNPPNVAGWPGHDRHLSVGAELTKAQLAFDLMWDAPPPDAVASADTTGDVIDELCWRAGIEPGAHTRATLDEAYVDHPDEWEPYRAPMALIALTPEFNIV